MSEEIVVIEIVETAPALAVELNEAGGSLTIAGDGGDAVHLAITEEGEVVDIEIQEKQYPSGPILNPPVIDALDSVETDAALSANQGRVLDGKIGEVRTDYGDHEEDFAGYFGSLLV